MPKTTVKTCLDQEISVFNTGRGYTADGQRIAYCVMTTGNIAMYDVDRSIWYVLKSPPDWTITDALVLRLYDTHAEATHNGDEYRELIRLTRDLGPAARELAPSIRK
jgi:hypothetical protein